MHQGETATALRFQRAAQQDLKMHSNDGVFLYPLYSVHIAAYRAVLKTVSRKRQ